jgi:hypothetical protein
LIGVFSGDILPPTLFGTQKQMLIQWASDVGLSYLGWTATYSTRMFVNLIMFVFIEHRNEQTNNQKKNTNKQRISETNKQIKTK